MARNWLHTKTRAELRQTMGWGDPPVVSSKDKFSAHHPMIPRRYVPAWQLDMQNRRNIIKVRRRGIAVRLALFYYLARIHSQLKNLDTSRIFPVLRLLHLLWLILLMQNCELAGNSMWSGHISYFLNGRGSYLNHHA